MAVAGRVVMDVPQPVRACVPDVRHHATQPTAIIHATTHVRLPAQEHVIALAPDRALQVVVNQFSLGCFYMGHPGILNATI